MTQVASPRRGRRVTGSPRIPPAVARAAAGLRDALNADSAANPIVLVVTRTLGLLALFALWLVVFGTVLSSLAFSHAQHDLYSTFRTQLAAGTAPLGGSLPEGVPVALISSSAADLHGVVVVEGASSRALQSGPGHRPGTPLPGQAGASLLLGRATSFGAPFSHIADLDRGDTISVTTGQGAFTYAVLDVRRSGDPLPAQLKPGASQLTLVTAEGSGWRSGWAPSGSVYVDALLKGQAAPAPTQGSIASEHDGVFKRDTRGLYPLVLWLQLLLVAGIGGIWVRSRWGVARAWLLGLPVGAAALWGASTALWLLLPNVL